MKKGCLCLLMLCLLALFPIALGDTAHYAARANREFHLRLQPADEARRVRNVQPRTALEVLEYGEEWCHVRLQGDIGYARTRWLSQLRSLDPLRYSVPGYDRQAGLAVVTAPATAAVAGYGGNGLQVGDVLTVRSCDNSQATLSMLRDHTTLAAHSLRFTPFTPWQEAEPGQVIGGFTTYYNQQTGGRLAANRQHNIELAAQRIDGLQVAPGQGFSFNGACGPYRKSNGYAIAPNISQDGQGYGGGVCQVSTTLYLAALGLPFQVEEWALHRERGVDYAPQGFDAAVGTYSDLVLTSLLPYPVCLVARPQQGVLTVLIHRAGAPAALPG